MFLIHTLAGIIIGEMVMSVALGIAFQMYADAVTGIFQAVLDKISEHGIYERGIPLYDKIIGKHVLDLDPPAFKRLAELLENLIGNGLEADLLLLQLLRGLLNLGDEGDVTD